MGTRSKATASERASAANEDYNQNLFGEFLQQPNFKNLMQNN
jgi:hypothetical protein